MISYIILGPPTTMKKNFLKRFFGIEDYSEKKIIRILINQQQCIFIVPFLTTFSEFRKNYIKYAAKAVIFGDYGWTLENLKEQNSIIEVLHQGNSNLSEEDLKGFLNLSEIDPQKPLSFTEMHMEC